MQERRAEHWMQTKWRPLMALQYMVTCLCDFVVFPVLWSALQYKGHGEVTSQWQPITLQAGGFYHISMGAILGIAAWGRTKEKVDGVTTQSIPDVVPTPLTNIVPHTDQPVL